MEEIEKYKAIRDQINELSTLRGNLNERISKLNDQIRALESAQIKRRAVVKTEISEQTKRVLEKDLPEHNDFEHLERFDFSFEDDWFAINGEPNITTSASGMVVVKNSLFVGMLLASLHDKKMLFPRFLLLDNVEDKGMVGERVRNFQAVIAEMLSEEKSPHQVIMTTSTLNPKLDTKAYVIGEYYTASNRTLKNQ